MKKIDLIIEKVSDEQLWGRVAVDDNLIVDDAPSLAALKKKLSKLLNDFHDLKPAAYDFDVSYDLAALFEEKKYLNLTEVASRIGINRSLMAQYASGTKFPSAERAGEIEKAIHQMGRDLLEVRLAVKGRSVKAINKAQKARQKAKA